MSKIGLVLEGGGMRGAYTAGVLHWLLEEKLHFDYVVGISSGAMYAGMYVLGKGESLHRGSTVVAADKRNVGVRAVLRERTLIGYEFIYREVTETLDFPLQNIDQISEAIQIGVYDLAQEKTVWMDKYAIAKNPKLIQAACTLPIMGRAVKIDGKRYLDAGITTMIPIQQSIDAGCAKHMIITTKSKNYVRKPQNKVIGALLRFTYRKFPKLIRDFENRTSVYYKERNLIDRLVDQGDALYMYPSEEVGVGRTSGSLEQFELLFETARKDCEARREEIIAFYRSVKQ